MVEQKDGKNKILVSFVCETLKAEKAAEEHIRQFMPKLAGLNAVGMRCSLFSSLSLSFITCMEKILVSRQWSRLSYLLGFLTHSSSNIVNCVGFYYPL